MRHYLKMESILKALVYSIMMFDLILLTKGELNTCTILKLLAIYTLTFIISLKLCREQNFFHASFATKQNAGLPL